MKSSIFLAVRMAIYVIAVPAAAYFGGSFDPETGNLTLNVNDILDMAWGVMAAGATFAAGRVAKSKGGMT